MNAASFLARRGALFLLSLAGALSGAVPAAELTVELSGHAVGKGRVRVALYRDGDAFPTTPWRGLDAAAEGEGVVLVFKDLPPGAYALSAYQDDNANGKLDRGRFGIPRERYGFSRDARGDKGPPEFRDAHVEVGEVGARAAIRLH